MASVAVRRLLVRGGLVVAGRVVMIHVDVVGLLVLGLMLHVMLNMNVSGFVVRFLLHMVLYMNVFMLWLRIVVIVVVRVVLWTRQVWLIHFLLRIWSHVHDDRATTKQCVIVVISGIVWISDTIEGDRLAHNRVFTSEIGQKMAL